MSDTPLDPVEHLDPDEEKWPIGFMVVVALVALYLGWRVIQLIAMGIDWLL